MGSRPLHLGVRWHARITTEHHFRSQVGLTAPKKEAGKEHIEGGLGGWPYSALQGCPVGAEVRRMSSPILPVSSKRQLVIHTHPQFLTSSSQTISKGPLPFSGLVVCAVTYAATRLESKACRPLLCNTRRYPPQGPAEGLGHEHLFGAETRTSAFSSVNCLPARHSLAVY